MSGADLVCPCCGTIVPGASLQQRVAAAREVVSPTVALIVEELARRPGQWVLTGDIVSGLWGCGEDGGPEEAPAAIRRALIDNRARLASLGLRVSGRIGRIGGYRLEVAA